jgi:hypothetical protein
MRRLLSTCLVLIVGLGSVPAALAAAAGPSTSPGTTNMPEARADSGLANAETSAHEIRPAGLTAEGPSRPLDCGDQAPSSGSTLALLSRVMRSSGVASGIQCPILPISGTSALEDFRP